MSHYLNSILAAELSSLTRYFDRVIQWKPKLEDSDSLLSLVFSENKQVCNNLQDFSGKTAILLDGNFNHHYDIQALLQELKPKMKRGSRILAIAYNPYLAWFFRLANFFKLRKGELPFTFLTRTDLNHLSKLSHFEVVKIRPILYFPWRLLGLGSLINRCVPVIPLVRWLAYANLIVLRPLSTDTATRPTLSIVIPARNEMCNIENAITRMPDLGTQIEIIFVEGHSSDATWEEILRIQALYSNKFKIKAIQQTGKGKNDAVRAGFQVATGDLLTILDADLTMPPELLGRFYEAYIAEHADFINGSRLLYPMEGEAMRFLNRLGNTFFAKALSWVLDTQISDSLCGTKLFSKQDYQRIVRWREVFGDFDPFGDFELLFPAAVLGLGIIDVPIRYRARTYGTTNISRFQHGWQLLRMTTIGFFKIKLGRIKI